MYEVWVRVCGPLLGLESWFYTARGMTGREVREKTGFGERGEAF